MLRHKSLLLLVLLPLLANAQDVAVCDFAGSIRGSLTLSQYTHSNVLRITGELIDYNGVLSNGKHGFHVHEFGQLGNSCNDAGGHYNPYGNNHGAPEDTNRHVGDLGNVVSDNGIIIIDITDTVALIRGGRSILNRAIVLHADRDDLGEGGETDSLTTGHAGARVDCCVITQLTNPDDGDDGPSEGGNGEQGSEGGGGGSKIVTSTFVIIAASLACLVAAH